MSSMKYLKSIEFENKLKKCRLLYLKEKTQGLPESHHKVPAGSHMEIIVRSKSKG